MILNVYITVTFARIRYCLLCATLKQQKKIVHCLQSAVYKEVQKYKSFARSKREDVNVKDRSSKIVSY